MNPTEENSAHGYTEGSELHSNGKAHETFTQEYLDQENNMNSTPAIAVVAGLLVAAVFILAVLAWLWINGKL